MLLLREKERGLFSSAVVMRLQLQTTLSKWQKLFLYYFYPFILFAFKIMKQCRIYDGLHTIDICGFMVIKSLDEHTRANMRLDGQCK